MGTISATSAWLPIKRAYVLWLSMFKPFIHGEVRLFGLSELAAAKDWITDAKRAGV
jgi:hypothetical protein